MQSLQDVLSNVLLSNPISATTLEFARSAVNGVTDYTGIKPKKGGVSSIMSSTQVPLWKLARASGPFVRIAAISGAAAVVLGAYGSHKTYPSDAKGLEQKRVFDTASRYHLFHTLALLGVPMCRMPYLSGSFMMAGLLMFCGTCYYYAFTGDKSYSRLTPIGGTCFILGWLGMLI
ncbi:transmembrane protein 256-like [Trichogramma pretiosum]|uniref:transmembrane protein 256-like n=1 Tax=Trichogramma pretiosum TaxID=7493 RepID=UPI0006C95252|nr:transmembrane protein 256-like [Trichogramma pretiosum]